MRSRLKIWKENRTLIVVVPVALMVTIFISPGSLYDIQYFDRRIAKTAQETLQHTMRAIQLLTIFITLAELCAVDPKEFNLKDKLGCSKSLRQ